jgi:hypothetical protein
MALDPHRDLYLIDMQGRLLGTVWIERIEGDRVFARFDAATAYSAVQSVFADFENAVNDQLFVADKKRCPGTVMAI